MNVQEPFSHLDDDPLDDPSFSIGHKRLDQCTDNDIMAWGKITDRITDENRKRLAAIIQKRTEYHMPDDMAVQLKTYLIRCAEAVGYAPELISFEAEDCFASLGSVHHVIRERVTEFGISLVFEENCLQQNLITNECINITRTIIETPLSYDGIRKIAIEAFKHISSLNLEHATEEVMNEKTQGFDGDADGFAEEEHHYDS